MRKAIHLKIYCILWCFGYSSSYGLNMNDFIPSFLRPTKVAESSIDPNLAFSMPHQTRKREASNPDNNGYCSRRQDVFCDSQSGNESGNKVVEAAKREDEEALTIKDAYTGTNSSYFNRNSNNYDQNAISNFNITNSNQAALQVYSPKLNNLAPEDQIKNNFTLPLHTDKNTEISIGQQQIEFNIKY